MYKYILKRILLSIISLIIIFVIVFCLLQLVNKNPDAIESEISEKESSARHLSHNIRGQVYNKYNYHPEYNTFTKLWIYLKNIFINADFGYYYDRPIQTIPKQFLEPLKFTFMVVGTSFIFGSLLGIIFGIWAGYKRGKLTDIALNLFAILFISIPSFVIAALIVFFGIQNDWPIEFLTIERAGSLWNMIKTILFPILIITITSFATLTYYIRNEVVEVLTSDYIATARSKGLSEWQIFSKHVFKNISIPIITIILPRFVFIITGSFIIERFFKVPGTANMFSTAIVKFEPNVIMFSVLFFTSLKLGINIIVDILYTILDPRIKFINKNKENFINKIINYRKRMLNKKEVQND